MTITEFLEARIAEDEADAASWRLAELEPHAVPGHPGAYLLPPEATEAPTLGAWGRDRVLAEAAAKRAIINEYTPYGSGYDAWSAVMQHLAAIYADHPDYREEWKS